MYDFIAAYFIFLPAYPLFLIGIFWGAPLKSLIWLIVIVVILRITTKLNLVLYRKIFISVWVMPGTIVCGSAAIVPWPLTVPGLFSKYGCANSLSISVTLIFNLILVFLCSALITKIRGKRATS